MNWVNILLENNTLDPGPLTLGGVLGLWNVARNKIVSWRIYLLYVRQAQDPKLKKHLSTMLQSIPKQIGMITKFLKEKGLEAPEAPDWDKKINDNSAFLIPTTLLSDREIAESLREQLMAAINLETEALRSAILPDSRKLLYQLFSEDDRTYDTVIALQKEKNWTNFSPELLPQ